MRLLLHNWHPLTNNILQGPGISALDIVLRPWGIFGQDRLEIVSKSTHIDYRLPDYCNCYMIRFN